MKRLVAAVAPLILALGLAACSSASGAQPASSSQAGPADVRIVASNISFEQASVDAPADRSFSVDFVNQDDAPHNVAIYTDAGAGTKLFSGDIVQKGETTYQVPALKAGTYFFRCDVHPDMHGEIVVK